MTKFSFILAFLLPFLIFSQSIHQEQSSYYSSIGKSNAWYESNTTAATPPARTKSSCNLNKVVYGWHPYWMGNTYQNYDWDLLSHFSFFDYEVDASSGNALDIHGFNTSAAVTAAINSGNTKVTLCVTLFSNHATFLNNSTSKQTLITNLINLIQNRGAHGVNIDFEGLPNSEKTNFANFMVDLANQMHSAIPNSHVSSVLYAVDWNEVFDFTIMASAVDHFIIMGYDYYWSGSTTTGPNDPLFHFGSNYNYTLSKSITYYLDKGCPKNKLVLGLPYYGRQWSTTSTSVPSSITGTGTAVFYNDLMTNSSGNYSVANHQYDNDSYTDIYVFNSGGTKQCFITKDTGMRKRLELINNTGIAGMGIWALGYDDGYNTFWTAIEDYLTDCAEQPCPGDLHDFGGPTRDYYNNEDYTWTIAPPNAGSITVNFSSFSLENNFDFLYVYDGPNTSSPQIAGSPFTGTTIPTSFTSSLGALTFRFTSDGGSVSSGFNGTYTCANGSSIPTTAINSNNLWKTADFATTFTDQDNVGVTDSFYLAADFDGSEWRSNPLKGFLYEKFDLSSIHTDWTSSDGTWNVVSNELTQTNETSSNTNISIPISQSNQNNFLYEWKGKIEGTGTNRRFGMHFFCDDASQTNRNNSYLVYWYPDQGKCRLHKASNNTLNFITETNVSFNPSSWYNFKVYYNPNTGEIKTYLNDILTLSYTDTNPLQSGNSVSLRTGEAVGYFDDIKVFKSRTNNATITIGSALDDIRYQNPNPSTPAGRIESIVLDGNENLSTTAIQLENIDWTTPSTVTINDGPTSDINSFSTPNQIQANWTTSLDSESGLLEYQYAIGTTNGGTDITNWTSNGTNTSLTQTGLSLTNGTTYYVSVKAINNATLETQPISSNGQTLQGSGGAPYADFSYSTTAICPGDSVQFTNTSLNASTFSWAFGQGSPSSSSLENPSVVFPNSGTYTISLVAIGPGGTDILTQNINIIVSDSPVSAFSPVSNPIYVPNATAYFNNNSSNSNSYTWDFGNGANSTDENPWTIYSTPGVYTVTLIAQNGLCGSDTSSIEIEVINNVGIDELGLNSNIKLYPNPFINNLNLEINSTSEEIITIKIYDIIGKKIYNKEFNVKQGMNIISINNSSKFTAKGNYILVVDSESINYTQKLIKK